MLRIHLQVALSAPRVFCALDQDLRLHFNLSGRTASTFPMPWDVKADKYLSPIDLSAICRPARALPRTGRSRRAFFAGSISLGIWRVDFSRRQHGWRLYPGRGRQRLVIKGLRADTAIVNFPTRPLHERQKTNAKKTCSGWLAPTWPQVSNSRKYANAARGSMSDYVMR